MPGIICICVIDFHHKLGPILEYIYPEDIKNKIDDFPKFELLTVSYGLPDSIHNNNEDYLYFNFKTSL